MTAHEQISTANFANSNSSRSDSNNKDQQKSSPASWVWFASCALWVFPPLLLVWVGRGVVTASLCSWIPIPFWGYFRSDFAVIVVVFAVYMLYRLRNRRTVLAAVVFHLAIIVPHLPEPIKPVFYMFRPPYMYWEYYRGDAPRYTSRFTVQEHPTGLTVTESDQIAQLAWEWRQEWTHLTRSCVIGYFQFGPSMNFDREDPLPSPTIWSFLFGWRPTPERLGRESLFRLRYPHLRHRVAQILQQGVLPLIRPAYARTLNVSTNQIIFGDEIVEGLGIPALTIMLPNLLWHWLVNVHTDLRYAGRVRDITRHSDCRVKGYNADGTTLLTSVSPVTTFLIPITLPAGAGLKYWPEEGIRYDVPYKLGHVYTFPVATIHAIHPIPYKEWKRYDHRITVQAFGVPCEDGRWIIYH